MSKVNIKDVLNTPISHSYTISQENFDKTKKHLTRSSLEKIISNDNTITENSYYELGINGTNKNMYLLTHAISLMSEASRIIQKNYNAGFVLWDTYRTRETQTSLFEYIKNQIRVKNPSMNDNWVLNETEKYCANPNKKSLYPVSPHTTGAVLDLTIYDLESGGYWDMGTNFDDSSEMAHTSYFENNENRNGFASMDRFDLIQRNRLGLTH